MSERWPARHNNDLKTQVHNAAADRLTRLGAIVLLGILGLLAADRLIGLGSRGFHHDEAIHCTMAWQIAHEGPAVYRYDPVYHGPFLYHIVALTFRALGDSDALGRLPVALAGVALGLLLLAWRPWIGWGGAALVIAALMLSPVEAYYSRFARGDVFMALWLVGEITAGMWYLRTGRARWLLMLALGLALTHCTKENSYIHQAMLAGGLVVWVALRAWRSPRSTMRQVLIHRMPLTRLATLWMLISTAVFLYAAIDSRIGAGESLLEGLRRLAGKLVAIDFQAGNTVAAHGYLTGEHREGIRRIWILASMAVIGIAMALQETAGFCVRRPRAKMRTGIALFIGALSFYAIAGQAFATLNPALRAAPTGDYLWTLGREVAARGCVMLFATVLVIPGEWLARMGHSRRYGRWRGRVGELGLLIGQLILISYIYCVLFSSLGNNPAGPADGLYNYVAYWFRQQTGDYRIWGTWWYYLPRLALYELPALVLIALLGPWWLITGRKRFSGPHRWLCRPVPQALIGLAAWLTLTTLIAYSLLNEKVPWLLTYPSLGVNLLAGLLLAHWLAVVQRNRRWLLGLIALLVGFQLNQHAQAVFLRPNDASEVINYTMTSPIYTGEMRRIQAMARARETLGLPPLRIAVEGNGTWPASWDLRGLDVAWTKIDPQCDVQVMDDTPANWKAFCADAIGPWEIMRRPLRSWWIWHGDAGGLPGGTSLLANLWALATNAANDRQTSFPADQLPTPENYPTGFAHQVVDYVFNRRIWQPTASEQVLIAYHRPESSTAQAGGRLVDFHPANLVIGEGLLSAPRGLAALPGGGVAVADSGHGRIAKFGSDGAFLGKFGQNILIPTLTGPESLIFRSDPASSVTAIVADTWGHALRMFSADGTLLLSRAAGRDATGRISLYGPRGLASDATGQLLVTDTGNHVVRVFDREFRALASWGKPGQGPGEFREPVGIVVGRDDWVYVADAGNGRVQRFTPKGVFDRAYAWVQPGDPASVDTVGLEPQLALLDDGRIAVSLSVLGEVRVLEPGSGQWSVWVVSRPGVQEPLGLAADGQGGLWIADRAAQRIVRIRPEK